MSIHTIDHIRSTLKHYIIVMLLLLFPISNLYPQKNDLKNFQILVGITGGVSETEYDEINHQLDIRHLSGRFAKHDDSYGLDGVVVHKNRVILGASVLFFGYHKREGEDPSDVKVSLMRSTVMGKIGIVPLSRRKSLLYPFLGLASETIKVTNDFGGMIKTPGLLFNGYGITTVNNLALLYGLEYVWLLKDGGNVGFSMEIGGSAAITEDIYNWFDPGGYFTRLHVYIRIL